MQLVRFLEFQEIHLTIYQKRFHRGAHRFAQVKFPHGFLDIFVILATAEMHMTISLETTLAPTSNSIKIRKNTTQCDRLIWDADFDYTLFGRWYFSNFIVVSLRRARRTHESNLETSQSVYELRCERY